MLTLRTIAMPVNIAFAGENAYKTKIRAQIVAATVS